MKISMKRSDLGLGMKTVKGRNGTYLFLLTRDGSYHVFTEVVVAEAVQDCGVKKERGKNLRQMCKEIWDKS